MKLKTWFWHIVNEFNPQSKLLNDLLTSSERVIETSDALRVLYEQQLVELQTYRKEQVLYKILNDDLEKQLRKFKEKAFFHGEEISLLKCEITRLANHLNQPDYPKKWDSDKGRVQQLMDDIEELATHKPADKEQDPHIKFWEGTSFDDREMPNSYYQPNESNNQSTEQPGTENQ